MKLLLILFAILYLAPSYAGYTAENVEGVWSVYKTPRSVSRIHQPFSKNIICDHKHISQITKIDEGFFIDAESHDRALKGPCYSPEHKKFFDLQFDLEE